MNNSTYIIDLIDRMLDDAWHQNATSSEDTASWKAYREAEKLTDERLIPEFITYISQEKNDEKRSEAYWALGKITENTGNQVALQFLINQLDKEKKNKIAIKILSGIRKAEKPAETDLLPIFNIIKNHQGEYDTYLLNDDYVKNDAIFALQKTHNPEVEPLILAVCTAEDTDEYRLWYCLLTLQNIGTRASLPVLSHLAGHKKMDVAVSALFAILKIGDERELPIFEKYIQEGRNKEVALYALTKIGNSTHIPLIIKRIKDVLSRRRSSIIYLGDFKDDKSEVMHGIEFLNKFKSENTEITKFFELIKTKKWDKLFKEEQRFLTKLGI